jgi:hypothetical protein
MGKKEKSPQKKKKPTGPLGKSAVDPRPLQRVLFIFSWEGRWDFILLSFSFCSVSSNDAVYVKYRM